MVLKKVTLLILISLSLFCSTLFGQNQNPFELYHRIHKNPLKKEIYRPDSQNHKIDSTSAPNLDRSAKKTPLDTTETSAMDSSNQEIPHLDSASHTDSSTQFNPFQLTSPKSDSGSSSKKDTDKSSIPVKDSHSTSQEAVSKPKNEKKGWAVIEFFKEKIESRKTVQQENLKNNELIPEVLQDKTNLIVGTFVILVLFLTVVISFNREVINKVFRSILNDNFLNLYFRELKGRWSMQLVFLYMFFIANLALFIFLIFESWLKSTNTNLLNLCMILLAVYFIRHLVLAIIGSTYEITRETGQFGFTILLFNVLLGLILLPINMFVAFAPPSIAEIFIYIGFSLIGLFYALRVLRGFFIGARFLLHNFLHFLLYLCTIEIAPILIMVKYFEPYIQ